MLKKLFKSKKEEKIYAPLNGEIVNMQEVPDPVFSQKMMGEGIAIIPNEGKVYSPVNGEVIQVPDSKHAIGIVTDEGTEILIHVGLETVNLNGEGFTVNLRAGDQVTVGQLLMEIDLDFIKENATSTITPIVITNSGNSDKVYTPTTDKAANAGETVIITVTEK